MLKVFWFILTAAAVNAYGQTEMQLITRLLTRWEAKSGSCLCG